MLRQTLLFVLCGVLLLVVHTQAQTISGIFLRYGLGNKVPIDNGMVYVTVNGISRPICNDGFGVDEAIVVCRQLGFDPNSFAISLPGGQFAAQNTRPNEYWLTQLECEGEELSINDCSFVPIGTGLENCESRDNNYASVVCLGDFVTTTTSTTTTTTMRTTTLPEIVCTTPDPNIRLVKDDVVHPYEGQVEIRRGGVWGNICDDRWGIDDARVVARMLCYNSSDARAHVGGFLYGNRSTSSYLLNEVRCEGNEESIFDCPAVTDSALIETVCKVQEAAAVSVREGPDAVPSLPYSKVECSGADETIHVYFPKSDNPGLQPRHLSLSDPQWGDDCATVGQDADTVFITIPFIDCGTFKKYNDTYIIYSNQIKHAIISSSDITRQEQYTLDVHCLMGRNGDPENEVDPNSLTLAPVYGEGEPILELNFFTSSDFSVKIAELPAQFRLGTRVYVAIELITRDEDLKVILQQCYATPGSSRDSQPQRFLIYDKCTKETSVVLYPISETLFGFSFLIFEFTDEIHDFLYLHCKGIVCGISEKYGRCDRTCGTGVGGIGTDRRKRSVDDVAGQNEVEFSGPFNWDTRAKRQAMPFEPVGIKADKGPIYIMRDRPTVSHISNTMITPQPSSQRSTRRITEGFSHTTVRVNSSNSVSSTITPRSEVPPSQTTAEKPDIAPVLVQDYPIASTATLLQMTLSVLVTIVMTLILH